MPSQGAQDAILSSIFSTIGETNRFYVEFGFNGESWERGSGANTEALWRRGWRGLLLDGRRENASINLRRAYVKSTTITGVLQQAGVPTELDYLSIDIDSAELWVLRALLSPSSGFQPRVVSVEYNSNFEFEGPLAAPITFPDPATMPILHGRASWNLTCFFGASPRALVDVAADSGFVLVANEPLLDLFFVRRDVWQKGAGRRGRGSGSPSSGGTGKGDDPRATSPFGRSSVPPRGATKSSMSLQLAPRSNHAPMTVHEAHNLLDYAEYKRTGSVCAARAAAAKVLRAYAEDYRRATGSEAKAQRRCFKNLYHLEPRPCGRKPENGAKRHRQGQGQHAAPGTTAVPASRATAQAHIAMGLEQLGDSTG